MIRLALYGVLAVASVIGLVMGKIILPFQKLGPGSRWGNWGFGFDFSHNDVSGAVRGLLQFGLLLQFNPLRWGFSGGHVDEKPNVRDMRFDFGPLSFYGQFDGSIDFPGWLPFFD